MAATYPKDFVLYDMSHDEVHLSGSWCEWRPNAIKMTKIPNLYFIATVQLPFDTKVAYKYIVNGNWMTNPEETIETDAAGNTNNVFHTPSEADHRAATATKSPQTSSQGVFSSSNGNASSGAAPIAVGGAVASTGIAEAAAETAAAHGLGQTEPDTNARGAPAAPSAGYGAGADAPVGGAVASTGVAEEAAHVAAAHGLGHSETEGVTGVEKVAPGVTQAVAGGSSVNEKDLAKPDLQKAPLPASTIDAPLAPGQEEHEGKGLFAVIGGLGAAAAATAYKVAVDLEHKIEEKLDGKTGGVSTTASPTTSTVGATNGTSGSFATTATAGSTAPALAGASHKDPSLALKGIATNDATARITHDLGQVDLQHTKAEVVGAVERLGGAIVGGLAGISGATAHEGEDLGPMDSSWAKKASASATSAFGKPMHVAQADPAAFAASSPAAFASLPTISAAGASSSTGSAPVADISKDAPPAATLPPVTGGPALYPTDGTSAPAPIKIEEPAKDVSHVQKEASKDGADAPALSTNSTEDSKKPGLMQKLKNEIKGDSSSSSTAADKTTSATTGTTSSKDNQQALGVGQAPTPAATSSTPAVATAGPPVTPKKTAAAGAGTSGTPNTDGYKTAPTTPAGKDGERKRKSSFFHKIKSALSPNK